MWKVKAGWDLLALLIVTVPPPPCLNFLTVFLMRNGRKHGQAWISEMHRTQYERSLNGADKVMTRGDDRLSGHI